MPFTQLPDAVTSWIEQTLGGPITSVVDKQGGFSPGVAAVVTTDRAHGFVKAVGASINTQSVEFHRAESSVMARLPITESVLLPLASTSMQVDGDEWDVMVFPAIDGTTPRHPWAAADLERVLDSLAELGDQFTPSPWPGDETRHQRLAAFFRGWTRIAGDDSLPWASRPWVAGRLDELVAIEPILHEQLRGDTLSHCDLRADNVLLAADRVGSSTGHTPATRRAGSIRCSCSATLLRRGLMWRTAVTLTSDRC